MESKAQEAPDEDIAPGCPHIHIGHRNMVPEPKHLVGETLVGLILLKELRGGRKRKERER